MDLHYNSWFLISIVALVALIVWLACRGRTPQLAAVQPVPETEDNVVQGAFDGPKLRRTG